MNRRLVLASFCTCWLPPLSAIADPLLPAPEPLPLALVPRTKEDSPWLAARKHALETLVGISKRPILGPIYGFSAPATLETVAAEVALPRFVLPLRRLKSFSQGDSPRALLVDQSHTLFLVSLLAPSGKALVVSSLTLAQRGDIWHAASFGPAAAARRIAGALGVFLEKALPESQFRFSLVTVAGLNMQFIGAEDNVKLWFVPIETDDRMETRRGEPVAAEEMLRKLKPDALRHNSLPG